MVVDSFSINWHAFLFYAFPPFILINRIVAEDTAGPSHRGTCSTQLAEQNVVLNAGKDVRGVSSSTTTVSVPSSSPQSSRPEPCFVSKAVTVDLLGVRDRLWT